MGFISTNTLLAEGDTNLLTGGFNYDCISTNTLLAEGDGEERLVRFNEALFQPTPSSRRVTDFSICILDTDGISTNTLLAEGD